MKIFSLTEYLLPKRVRIMSTSNLNSPILSYQERLFFLLRCSAVGTTLFPMSLSYGFLWNVIPNFFSMNFYPFYPKLPFSSRHIEKSEKQTKLQNVRMLPWEISSKDDISNFSFTLLRFVSLSFYAVSYIEISFIFDNILNTSYRCSIL